MARKLTAAQVREIRTRRARFEPVAAVAADYGVTRGTVSRVASGRSRRPGSAGHARWGHRQASFSQPMTQVNVADTDAPVASVAVTVTVNSPGTGRPEIRPVEASIVSPGGSWLAV